MNRGRALVLGGAGLVALAALAGCSSGAQTPRQASDVPHNPVLTAAQQKRIHTIVVAPSVYHTVVTTTGVVDFDRNRATTMVAPFSGAVTHVRVTRGQKVKKGEALATVDSPDFATAAGNYRKALLAARAADAVARNDRDLYAHRAISARENAQAQTDAASADTERDAALKTLVALHVGRQAIEAIRAGKPVADAPGVIRAPIAGTVVKRSIAPGQTIAAGSTPCFTIADTSTMWVRAHVFGNEVAEVHVGDTATVDPGDGGEPLTGTVTNVGTEVDPDTRAVDVRIGVSNPHDVLKRQMYVGVRIRSGDSRQGLLIPVSALLRDDENLPFVYVRTPHSGYARHRVTLGPRIGDRFVIRDGLQAGDKVVVDGSIFLRFIQNQ